MSNHVESLLSLSHVWQVPQAGAVEEDRQPAAQKVRRAGSTCARWTVAEEQRLTEAVTELGERAWGDVAARINAENPARGRVAERSVSSVEQQLVVDILWSDPTDSDSELGIQPNFVRDPNGTGNILSVI